MPGIIQSRQQRAPGSQPGGSLPSYAQPPTYRPKRKDENLAGFANFIQGRAGGPGQAGDALLRDLMQRLQDPTGYAEGLLPYFQKSLEGSAAPLLRRAGEDRMRLSANVASRFGGNVSQEELRQTNQFDDLTTRAIMEMSAQLGPQALQAGGQQTNQLLSGYGIASGRESDLQSQILAALAAGKNKDPSFWAKLLGTATGVGASFIPGL
jgi:hypothetical protein